MIDGMDSIAAERQVHLDFFNGIVRKWLDDMKFRYVSIIRGRLTLLIFLADFDDDFDDADLE